MVLARANEQHREDTDAEVGREVGSKKRSVDDGRKNGHGSSTADLTWTRNGGRGDREV